MSEDCIYKKLLIRFLLIIVITFPVLFCSCKSANFEVSNLVIEPAQVLTGETVTVTVDVTNTGGAEGTYDVLLLVNGVNKLSKEITLAPETTGTVRFTLVQDSPGTYSIAVAELSDTLTVITLDDILRKTAQAMAAVNSYHFNCAIEVKIPMPEESFSFFEETE